MKPTMSSLLPFVWALTVQAGPVQAERPPNFVLILAAAGLSRQITPQMTGLNLLPSACGEQPLPNRAVFGAIYPNDAKSLGEPSRHVLMRWIRRGDFKLIAPAAKNTPRLLFDLGRDPREEMNLAGRPEFELREKHLQNLLDQWWAPGDDSDVAKPGS